MKKAQASSSASRLRQELITFPGYAGILFGWLLGTGLALRLFINSFITNRSVEVVQVQTISPGGGTSIFALVLSAGIIAAMVVALWVYIANWTKNLIRKFAQLLHISAKNYWAFCTILLMIGWLATCLVAFAVSGDEYLGALLFTSAGAITVGSVSFGLAALVNIPAGAESTRSFSIAFAGQKNPVRVQNKQVITRTQRREKQLKRKSHPDYKE